MNQSTTATATDISMTDIRKEPVYPSMDTMSTEKAMDSNSNQVQIQENPDASSFSLLRLRGGCGCIAGCIAGMCCCCC